MKPELSFWTRQAANEAINTFVSGKAYGVIYPALCDLESHGNTISLYAETMSHAKRMAKRLRAHFDVEAVVRPYNNGGEFSVSFTTSTDMESSFRRDFLWGENEIAHALTLFHLLISLEDIGDYLHRTPTAILSQIGNFINIPVLRPSDDAQLDLLIDELIEAIFLCDAGFMPVRSNPPGNNWLKTNYARHPHMMPILRVVEKHRIAIDKETLVTDLVGALKGIKCKNPECVFESLLRIVEALVEKPKITSESYGKDLIHIFDTHFENLYPLYVMARDFESVSDPWFYPPYGESEGMGVVREVLQQVINELAIDEVLGLYDGITKITPDQKKRASILELVSKTKQADPLIQTAYAVSAGDVDTLLELAHQGNWHAALIGASLADWDGDWSTSARNDFVDMCRNPARRIDEDPEVPFSSLRQCKNRSILARRILNDLQEWHGPNVL